MKKINFLMQLAFVIILLIGCTQIESLQEYQPQKQERKVSIIKNNGILKNTLILKEISKIQKEKLSNSLLSKSIQDSILDGASISTENVMLIENGEQKTYTFPIHRSFTSSKIENLVLKQNSDKTFSGILIQYDITAKEKELFISGYDVDLKNKIKIFDINKLHLGTQSRVQTDVIGCYVITWETGWCSSGQHSSGNDSNCTVGGAPNPTILSIANTCSGGAGGTNTGLPSYPEGDPGYGSSAGGYDTTPYSEDQLIELNKVFRLKLNSSQLSWYDSNTIIAMELAKFYYADNSIVHLNFLKSVIDYMKSSNNTQDTLLFANIVSFLKQDGSYQENWDLITNIVNEHDPTLGIEVLNFIKENPDTLNRAEIIDRIKALDNALAQNPNLLLDIACNQLPFWQEVATHQVPQSVKTKLENIKNQTSWWSNWQITSIDDGASARINMDLFPIKINTLPNKPNSTQKYTPEEFFNFFRLNINLFAEKFTPIVDSHYGIDDTALWNSSNPLGSLIHIEIPIDDGTVICSGFSTNAWIFSTIKAPMGMAYDGIHPVAGNRAFSYYMEGNTMYIYTRGVDRVSKKVTDSPNLANYLMESSAFYGADQLWKGMQDKLSKYVNERGGNAVKVPEVTYRPKYSKIRDYLKGKAPLSSLDCN